MAEFRRASNELKSTFDREMNQIEVETREIRDETQKYTNELYNYDSYYDSGAYGTESLPESSDSNLLTANEPSTVGASATQGAESTEPTTTAAASETTTEAVHTTEPAPAIPAAEKPVQS
jgi:sec-independent protein translocase protein TatA